MYIVAILDEGRERNLRCSSVMMTPDGLFLVTADRSYQFSASDLIGIIAVEEYPVVEHRAQPWLRVAGGNQ